jgi:hypothetical protein
MVMGDRAILSLQSMAIIQGAKWLVNWIQDRKKL